jgi:hypothetical protein
MTIALVSACWWLVVSLRYLLMAGGQSSVLRHWPGRLDTTRHDTNAKVLRWTRGHHIGQKKLLTKQTRATGTTVMVWNMPAVISRVCVLDNVVVVLCMSKRNFDNGTNWLCLRSCAAPWFSHTTSRSRASAPVNPVAFGDTNGMVTWR